MIRARCRLPSDAAYELAVVNVGYYPKNLALAQVNEDETTTWIAKGDGLAQLLTSRNEHPTQRSV